MIIGADGHMQVRQCKVPLKCLSKQKSNSSGTAASFKNGLVQDLQKKQKCAHKNLHSVCPPQL